MQTKQDSEYIGQFYADIEMQTRQESDKFSCRMKTFFFPLLFNNNNNTFKWHNGVLSSDTGNNVIKKNKGKDHMINK